MTLPARRDTATEARRAHRAELARARRRRDDALRAADLLLQGAGRKLAEAVLLLGNGRFLDASRPLTAATDAVRGARALLLRFFDDPGRHGGADETPYV